MNDGRFARFHAFKVNIDSHESKQEVSNIIYKKGRDFDVKETEAAKLGTTERHKFEDAFLFWKSHPS